jgi:ADP-glucose pyrophosphorylase
MEGYWTVPAFWEAKLEVDRPVPEFNFYDPRARSTPMRSCRLEINCCDLNAACSVEGCIIPARILHSIIGVRPWSATAGVIEHTVMMGGTSSTRATVACSAAPRRRRMFHPQRDHDTNARIGDGANHPEGKDNIRFNNTLVIQKHYPSGTRINPPFQPE